MATVYATDRVDNMRPVHEEQLLDQNGETVAEDGSEILLGKQMGNPRGGVRLVCVCKAWSEYERPCP